MRSAGTEPRPASEREYHSSDVAAYRHGRIAENHSSFGHSRCPNRHDTAKNAVRPSSQPKTHTRNWRPRGISGERSAHPKAIHMSQKAPTRRYSMNLRRVTPASRLERPQVSPSAVRRPQAPLTASCRNTSNHRSAMLSVDLSAPKNPPAEAGTT